MRTILSAFSFIIFFSAVLYSCSKGGDGGSSNACAGVSISVSGTVTDADAGTNNGSITATTTGGTGPFTFNIDGGSFQSSATFNGLAKGNHTVVAKDKNGCTGTANFAIGEKNACAGVNITLTATGTVADPCAPNGTITATAGGSNGFTYSIGSGAFQASNIFNNIAPGTYTVNVKDAAGCSKTANVTLTAATAGPLFTAVKGVIQANCAIPACHSGSSPQGGISFTVDCNIVINKDRIKARAIDGSPSIMPPTGALPQSEKDKITNWLAAGGKFTD